MSITTVRSSGGAPEAIWRFDTGLAGDYDSPVNSLAAYAMAVEADRMLSGSRLEGAFEYPQGLSLEFSADGGLYMHVLVCGREAEPVLSRGEIVPRPAGRKTLDRAAGSKVLSVEPLGLDRSMLVRLEQDGRFGSGGSLTLRLDFSPAFRAAVLFAGGGPPVWSSGTSASRVPESPGERPAERRWSLLDLPGDWSAGELRSAGAEGRRGGRDGPGGDGLADRLASSVGGIDPVLARALVEDSGGDPGRLEAALGEIGRSIREREFEWRLCDVPSSRRFVSPVAYPVPVPLPARPSPRGGMLEVLEVRARERIVPEFAACLRKNVLSDLRRERKKAQRLLRNLESDLEEASRAEEHRHMGNLLVTWRHILSKGMDEITVRDFSGDREVTIPLDGAAGPDRNIRSYFRRARKGEKGAAIIRARRSRARKELAEIEKRMKEIGKIEDPAELAALISRSEAGGGGRSGGEKSRPFRRIRVDERHVILVGRSGAENDELTHRYASGGDLWFHAQGVPGSHVVLRGADRSTPSSVIEMAAETAAWFSKARNSATVPVICAEKRYVRRPRGARPGTAVCQRSRTIFVTPRLHESGEDEG